MKRNKKKAGELKSGFTTGTAAAAATRGALSLLLGEEAPEKIRVPFLTDGFADVAVQSLVMEDETHALCTVVKDAGDDPDVTHKAVLGARVKMLKTTGGISVIITGGKGVGLVTKPGLEIPPGEAAINSGPRRMIKEAVREILQKHEKSGEVHVEIFAPKGEELAKKTLNSRLGVLGGISILGTTGIVRPLSHDGYTGAISAALSISRASNVYRVVLTTGRRSERFAQGIFKDLPEEAFIQMGDFFKFTMDSCRENGLTRLTLAVFFGKAVKMSQGIPHTHAAKSALTLKKLSAWALEITGDNAFARIIEKANTARHAFDIIKDGHPEIFTHVGERMISSARAFAGEGITVEGIIFDYNGGIIFCSSDLKADLNA